MTNSPSDSVREEVARMDDFDSDKLIGWLRWRASYAHSMDNSDARLSFNRSADLLESYRAALSSERARAEEAEEAVKGIWQALGIATYEQAKPFTIAEHIARLKDERDALREALEAIAACWDPKFIDGDEAAENMKRRALDALSRTEGGENGR